MNPPSRLTLKVFLLIVMNDSLDVVAQLLMKRGILHSVGPMSGLADVLRFLTANAGSVCLWLGILVYTLNFLIWIIVLSRIDLSIAVPVASTNYIVLPLLAVFILHETVSPLRWTGLLLIIAGIHFVSKSSRKVSETGVKAL